MASFLELLLYHENEAKTQYIIVIILVCVVEFYAIA